MLAETRGSRWIRIHIRINKWALKRANDKIVLF
jgi:hypothetical protein